MLQSMEARENMLRKRTFKYFRKRGEKEYLGRGGRIRRRTERKEEWEKL